MPNMQGLWRARPKVDEAEFEAAKTRTAARLADLFGVDAPAPDSDVAPPEASDEAAAAVSPIEADSEPEADPVVLPLWPGGPRPPIVVEERPDLVGVMAESARTEPHLVGVMAPAAEPAVRATRASRRLTAPAGVTPRRRADGQAKERPAGRTRDRRPSARPATAKSKAPPAAAAAATCPYCAVLISPPPSASRRCGRCRRRIVVKRVEGRAVYLTEAAVLVFEAERRRIASAGRFQRERERWLKLASAAGAPSDRATRLAAAQLSEETVAGCRTLYMTTVKRSIQAARRERRWEDAARIGRQHALALYRVAGSPVPPPEEIAGLHREALAAELRGIAAIARDAQLVAASCCDACRVDDGRVLRIATELRTPRLPHAGCPKGLCRCRWELAASDRTAVQRYLRRRSRADQAAAGGASPQAT